MRGAALVMLAAFAWVFPAVAQVPVGLAVVLALDRSQSVDGALLSFQLDGHAQAFRDPRVISAITGGEGGGGRIAAVVVSWSDPNALEILVPWTVIAGPADAHAFAARIEAAPRSAVQGSTGLGAALVEAARLFDRSGVAASRRVIDIVSNGYSNVGIWPESARDAVVARGITVNGLAMLDDVPWLGQYFADRVIGGPAAFVRIAADRASFTEAIVEKLMMEIAGLLPALDPGGSLRASLEAP